MDESPVTQKQMQDALSAANEALEMRLLERIEKSGTALLTEFRKWALPVLSRLRLNETWQAGFTASVTERLAFIEERLTTLEHK